MAASSAMTGSEDGGELRGEHDARLDGEEHDVLDTSAAGGR